MNEPAEPGRCGKPGAERGLERNAESGARSPEPRSAPQGPALLPAPEPHRAPGAWGELGGGGGAIPLRCSVIRAGLFRPSGAGVRRAGGREEPAWITRAERNRRCDPAAAPGVGPAHTEGPKPPSPAGQQPPKAGPPHHAPLAWAPPGPALFMGRGCCWGSRGATQAAPAPVGCGVHRSERGLPGSALAPPGALPGSRKAGVCSPGQTPPRPPPPPDKAVPRRQDGAGGTALSSQQGLGQPWLSSSPERPVPGTSQWRKPHCNRRAGSCGEGAFLGCLGAESPPATAATHTRRDATATHAKRVLHQDTQGHTQRGCTHVATGMC